MSNGLAIATKYNFTFTSRFSFLLKKLIDQKFVKKFNDLNQDNYYIFKRTIDDRYFTILKYYKLVLIHQLKNNSFCYYILLLIYKE